MNMSSLLTDKFHGFIGLFLLLLETCNQASGYFAMSLTLFWKRNGPKIKLSITW